MSLKRDHRPGGTTLSMLEIPPIVDVESRYASLLARDPDAERAAERAALELVKAIRAGRRDDAWWFEANALCERHGVR